MWNYNIFMPHFRSHFVGLSDLMESHVCQDYADATARTQISQPFGCIAMIKGFWRDTGPQNAFQDN